MTFTVRDLMIDVLPATFADADGLRLCEGNVTMPPKPQPPPPEPPPKPPRPGYAAATGGEQVQGAKDGAAELAPLPVLREQLHQALHP
jgi:hypothetical protein